MRPFRMSPRQRVLVTGFCALLPISGLTSAQDQAKRLSDRTAEVGMPPVPFAEATGQFGSAMIFVFYQGQPVMHKPIDERGATELLGAVEGVLQKARGMDPADQPSRAEVLQSGLTIEVYYRSPVQQQKLPFVPANSMRLFWLNRFVIPVTGKLAQQKVGGAPLQRVFPYEGLTFADGSKSIEDWSAKVNLAVYSSADTAEIRKKLQAVGVKLPPSAP